MKTYLLLHCHENGITPYAFQTRYKKEAINLHDTAVNLGVINYNPNKSGELLILTEAPYVTPVLEEEHPVLLKSNWAITPEMKERIGIMNEAWEKFNFWECRITAKWRNEIYSIANEYAKQIGNDQLTKLIDIEHVSRKRDSNLSNKYICAVRLLLTWAAQLKPELNAEQVYNSLQCRAAYIDLIATAYYVQR